MCILLARRLPDKQAAARFLQRWVSWWSARRSARLGVPTETPDLLLSILRIAGCAVASPCNRLALPTAVCQEHCTCRPVCSSQLTTQG